MNNILESLNSVYDGEFSDISILRDFIGCVCRVRRDGEWYVLKLYRPFMADVAERAANVSSRLFDGGVRVPRLEKTAEGRKVCSLTINGEVRRGILMEYVAGEEIDEKDMSAANLLGDMRSVMYDYPLPVNGSDFFVDRYVNVLTDMGHVRAQDFKAMGDRLYSQAQLCPVGFCHGDLHNGNLIREKSGRIAIIDFDAAATAFQAYDAVTYCDATDYFNISRTVMDKGFDETLSNLEDFKRCLSLTDAEAAAFPALIALRHFDIQATIIECLGPNCVDAQFIDNQYKWLENWTETTIAHGFII